MDEGTGEGRSKGRGRPPRQQDGHGEEGRRRPRAAGRRGPRLGQALLVGLVDHAVRHVAGAVRLLLVGLDGRAGRRLHLPCGRAVRCALRGAAVPATGPFAAGRRRRAAGRPRSAALDGWSPVVLAFRG